MNKHWIALLLAITATQAYAGEKEYSYKKCSNLEDIYSCEKCTELDGDKISFKVNKEINSVMKIHTKKDGSIHTNVFENCKIFDDNNFECKTELTEKEIITRSFSDKELTVTNGKWQNSTETHINQYKIDHFYYNCGTEIKNVLTFLISVKA
jgi:hypothetical protein